MRPLIIGSRGFIGKILVKHFAKYNPICFSSQETLQSPCYFDLRVRPYLNKDWIAHQNVTHAFLCSAIANPESCVKDPKLAHIVNVQHTKELANQLNYLGIKIIYFSTESVFDGVDGFFSENDSPRPRTTYGITKFQAEQHIHSLSNDHLILRLSRIESASKDSSSLISKIVRQLTRCSALSIAGDQFVAPLAKNDFLKMLDIILYTQLGGIWHVSTPYGISRYQLGLDCATALIANGIKCANITPCSLSNFVTAEPRPHCSLLIPSKFFAISEHTYTSIDAMIQLAIQHNTCKDLRL